MGQSIACVESIVDLRFIGNRNAHDEGRKGDVLDTLKLRCLNIDTSVTGAGREAL